MGELFSALMSLPVRWFLKCTYSIVVESKPLVCSFFILFSLLSSEWNSSPQS